MQRNYLDKPDYCIRKAIGVHCITQYLQETGETQQKLAEFVGVTQGTVSKWLNTDGIEEHHITSDKNSKYAPTLIHILKISAFLQKPLHVMLQDIILEEKKCSQFLNESMLKETERLAELMRGGFVTVPESIRRGEDHFTIINKLQKSRYVGFFVSADSDEHIEHLIIDTAMAIDSASVPATMRIVGKAENQYQCSVVSPPNQNHLYISIEQQSGKHDRGTIAFCVDGDMQGQFMCGSGYIMSTDRKSGENRIQWIVILRIGLYNDVQTPGFEHLAESTNHQKEKLPYDDTDWLNEADCEFVKRSAMSQADSIIESVLNEDLPAPTGHYISFSCLKDRQKTFYEDVYKRRLKSLGFVNDWNDTHRRK